MSLMDVSKIFSLLQPKEDDEEASGCSQELSRAVLRDDVDLLSALLSQDRYGRCVNVLSGWGVPVTPLRCAAAHGHLRCLQLLLAHGAQVDSLDVKAQTPLFTAVSGKHLDCVSALLDAGADPNGSPYNNCSPLLTAAREGHADILRELLRHGADVDVKPKVPDWASNATACRGPLYISACYGHLECFKLLLQHGANPDYNCTDDKMLSRIKEPRTVLEMCLKYGCGPRYIQLLLDFGANVYLPALILDKTSRENEAVTLLLKERVCPRTLMSQARLSLWKFLPTENKMCLIDCLDIPKMLKDYLNHVS
ncbi:ankyrin repeat and SOCS box protein 12b [Puntigrus tetrazona]|uniref:ankyrin repeat and SOCS box protein 12b n=1 Tax=Puntigrus tetrazona TaxID=1606681 RepID=UPI001C8AAD6E|nr:ankyrin repeat and SOCS box protein 12b [Puntigrus tetrazona]